MDHEGIELALVNAPTILLSRLSNTAAGMAVDEVTGVEVVVLETVGAALELEATVAVALAEAEAEVEAEAETESVESEVDVVLVDAEATARNR
jgi:hypothetical protein